MKIAIKSGLLSIKPLKSKWDGFDTGIIVPKYAPNPMLLKEVGDVSLWEVVDSDKTIEEELGSDDILLLVPGKYKFEKISKEPYIGRLINTETGQSVEEMFDSSYPYY
jgi:hypothetical protein